ncbi:MAG: hypothetical protein M3Z26_06310 [Bacteroidota bacterium]|nr:hypothetical protein [Bacteroidota bacterium]
MFTLFGWIGIFFYLLAYLLLALRKIKGEGIPYHIMNIVGAIGLTFNAFHLKDYPNEGFIVGTFFHRKIN